MDTRSGAEAQRDGPTAPPALERTPECEFNSYEAADAEAALITLAEPLEWHYQKSAHLKAYTTTKPWYTAKATYAFGLSAPQFTNLGCDENGIPFQWMIQIERCEGRDIPMILRPRPSAPLPVSTLWCFPCRTLAQGKSLCERLALTDDRSEVDRLDRLWYPLLWGPMGYGPQQKLCGPIYRNFVEVARYLVPREKPLVPGYFPALYELTQAGDEHCKDYADLDAYLRAYNLRPPSHSPYHYETEAEAKAACDRHHLTGAWESAG